MSSILPPIGFDTLQPPSASFSSTGSKLCIEVAPLINEVSLLCCGFPLTTAPFVSFLCRFDFDCASLASRFRFLFRSLAALEPFLPPAIVTTVKTFDS